jgi:hypothetical protein
MLSAIEAQGQGRQLFKAVKGFAFPEVPIRSFPVDPVLPAISSFINHDLRLLAPALPAHQSAPRWQYFFKQTNIRPTKSIQIKKLYEEFERLHPEFREIYLPPAPQKVIRYEPLSSEWDKEWIDAIDFEIKRVEMEKLYQLIPIKHDIKQEGDRNTSYIYYCAYGYELAA